MYLEDQAYDTYTYITNNKVSFSISSTTANNSKILGASILGKIMQSN